MSSNPFGPSSPLPDRGVSAEISFACFQIASNICILAGAGISTNAGIPDFRVSCSFRSVPASKETRLTFPSSLSSHFPLFLLISPSLPKPDSTPTFLGSIFRMPKQSSTFRSSRSSPSRSSSSRKSSYQDSSYRRLLTTSSDFFILMDCSNGASLRFVRSDRGRGCSSFELTFVLRLFLSAEHRHPRDHRRTSRLVYRRSSRIFLDCSLRFVRLSFEWGFEASRPD